VCLGSLGMCWSALLGLYLAASVVVSIGAVDRTVWLQGDLSSADEMPCGL
jgi:hypothetical protein